MCVCVCVCVSARGLCEEMVFLTLGCFGKKFSLFFFSRPGVLKVCLGCAWLCLGCASVCLGVFGCAWVCLGCALVC